MWNVILLCHCCDTWINTFIQSWMRSPHSDYVTRCYFNVLSREVITVGSLSWMTEHITRNKSVSICNKVNLLYFCWGLHCFKWISKLIKLCRCILIQFIKNNDTINTITILKYIKYLKCSTMSYMQLVYHIRMF